MSKEIDALSFPSQLESIAAATSRAVEIARAAGFSDDALFAIDLAVRETVTNAVMHGNQSDETKNVDLTFTLNDESLTISVRDYGAGFEPDEVPDPTAQANLLATSGRGMLFIRNFMDEATWQRAATGGTQVQMVKKR